MKVLKYWKIVEFQKISIKVKNCKTFYETQTASPLKEIIQPPPTPHTTVENLARSLKQNFLREIYRNIQTFDFTVFQESSSWASGNDAVQMFFSDTKQKHVCSKICRLRKFFSCVLGAYYFQFQKSWNSWNQWDLLSENVLQNGWSFSLVFIGFENFCYKFWNKNKIWWCPLERLK